jgi:hypothetical protein
LFDQEIKAAFKSRASIPKYISITTGDRATMKASKEIRAWINRLRKRSGKKNGVVPGFLFDLPQYEIKAAKSKHIKEAKRPGRLG